MSVPSFQFVLAAIVVALLVNVTRDPRWRQAVMLVANCAFLASFVTTPLAIVPLAGFLVFGFVAVRLLLAGHRRLFVGLLLVTLALFFWLKRYSFVPSSLFIDAPYVTIGLSYIFFRVAHLVIDAGQGALTGRLALLDYVNYTINFPCIVAGPIQMYPDWQKGHDGRPDRRTITRAAERIVTGLFKVMVVSSLLDGFQTYLRAGLLAGGGDPAVIELAAAVVAIYPVYLYFNFSGYTDVVVGASALMGLRLPENFDRPFSASNIIEFWNRWHITLSTWLRTYVYSPLLMTLIRRFPAPAMVSTWTALCFFVTFFLVGAWHGQTSEYIMFGVLQGGGVSVNKLYQTAMARRLGRKPFRALSENRAYSSVMRGFTFMWFAFTLLWFWGNWDLLARLYAAPGAARGAVALALVWLVATIVLDLLAHGRDLMIGVRVRGTALLAFPEMRAAKAGSMLFLLATFTILLSAPPPPIVYKQF
ncbi:MAG: MBOAT family O-acyltransferase [Janthinobacterium lividum]